MRYIFILLMCLMLLFAGVQFNDPDGLMWMAIYSLPAFWCALAAFARQAYGNLIVRISLYVSLIASLAGVIRFWPLTPEFWKKNVWFNVETAREGMGLMIVAFVIAMLIVTHGIQRPR